MKEERIEKKYDQAFSQMGAVYPAFPEFAKDEMSQMIEQIVRSNKNFLDISNTKQSAAIKGGFAAEEIITETFNLDAILKDKPYEMLNDRSKAWKNTSFRNKNDPKVDMAVLDKDGNVLKTSQSKFLQSPEKTAGNQGGMSSVKNGKPKYKDVDHLVGPKDQVNPTDGSVSIKEHAEAKAFASKKKGNFAQAEASQNTADKVTDQINYDGISSKKISRHEAKEVGTNTEHGKQFKDNYREEYQSASTLKHMKKAAKGAAVFSAISSGVYNTFEYCKMAKEGKISESEAVCRIVIETTSSAADSAFKAASNTGIQSLLVKHGSTVLREQSKKQFSKNLFRYLSARSNIVTVGVVCGIDLIKDMVRLATGKISKSEFEEKSGKNLFNTSAGVVGGSLGAQVASSIAFSGSLSVAMPVVGGLAGGLIGGIAMQFAIENHIEKPYKELITNTALLEESMGLFQEISNNIFQGQIIFNAYLYEERRLNNDMDTIMQSMAEAKQKKSNAIENVKNAVARL